MGHSIIEAYIASRNHSSIKLKTHIADRKRLKIVLGTLERLLSYYIQFLICYYKKEIIIDQKKNSLSLIPFVEEAL